MPLERLKNAADEFWAALAGVDRASAEVVSIVRQGAKSSSIRRPKPLKTSEVADIANLAVQRVKGNFYYRHCEVIWSRAPQIDGGYSDAEFECRIKFSQWWATLAKDVCQVRDTATESLCLAPHGPQRNYPLMGCINRFRSVYEDAGGKVAANRNKATKAWSPFVRWSYCIMRVLPTEVRPSSIPALGSFIRRYRLIAPPTSARK